MMMELLQELMKNDLFKRYWKDNNDIFYQPIVLDYEPVGEMGIYSKMFRFELPYSGDCAFYNSTVAIIDIKISSLNPVYSLESAIAGNEPFHNVCISIKKNNDYLLSCKYRLWDAGEAEYCGKETALRNFFAIEQSI